MAVYCEALHSKFDVGVGPRFVHGRSEAFNLSSQTVERDPCPPVQSHANWPTAGWTIKARNWEELSTHSIFHFKSFKLYSYRYFWHIYINGYDFCDDWSINIITFLNNVF